MIIYYDNGPRPFFRTHFINSGVPFSTIYRNPAAYYIDKITGLRFRPRTLVLNKPVCSPSDDKIICFDTYTTEWFFRWICYRFPEKRIILWFWNPIRDTGLLDMIPRRVEPWSYSREDCRKYGLQFNTTFYFDDLAQEAASAPQPCNEVPHVLFVGREKGRKPFLDQIGQLLREVNAVPDFHIMRNREWTDRTPGREHTMSYDQVAARIRQADVLLDYTMNPTDGISLRAMESLFWQKKLITNNHSIYEYDFYRRENIYVVGEDERSLSDFLRVPYQPVDTAVRQQYLLSSWLKRFDTH